MLLLSPVIIQLWMVPRSIARLETAIGIHWYLLVICDRLTSCLKNNTFTTSPNALTSSLLQILYTKLQRLFPRKPTPKDADALEVHQLRPPLPIPPTQPQSYHCSQ